MRRGIPRARRVELSLKTDGDWVNGAISDDGRGFDPSAMRGKEVWVCWAWKSAFANWDGSIRIVSIPGRGTRTRNPVALPGHSGG